MTIRCPSERETVGWPRSVHTVGEISTTKSKNRRQIAEHAVSPDSDRQAGRGPERPAPPAEGPGNGRVRPDHRPGCHRAGGGADSPQRRPAEGVQLDHQHPQRELADTEYEKHLWRMGK